MNVSFPEDDDTVRATLIRVLELKGMEREGRLIQMATMHVEQTDYDGWNGGTSSYTMWLRIPLEVFVQLEPELKSIESRILEIAQVIWREYSNDHFCAVTLLPHKVDPHGILPTPVPTAGIPAFWISGRFRLFISHCATQKLQVGALRDALDPLGISAFVAHEDMEPSREWQPQIESALRTAEALVAVVTDDFVTSMWCDQEVGFALGRGLPVIPVRFGCPPHGFIGKIQALPAAQNAPLANVAPAILQQLLKFPQTALSATKSLVFAFSTASSFARAKKASELLESVPKLDPTHAKQLRDAIETNSQIFDAFGVPERIARILKSQNL